MKTGMWLIIVSVFIAFSASASAQGIDVGKTEYQSNCAPCHGIDAKGNGPVSKELKTHPSDLTVLAKKNNGVFPLNVVYATIEGRDSIISHGTREMPIWGYRFKSPGQYSDDYLYLPPASSEAVIHSRILAVIDYLNRIQDK